MATHYVWKRGQKHHLSPSFTANEFECQCKKCDVQMISSDLIKSLQKVRNMVGPLIVTSGFRCAAHQAALRGSGILTAVGTSQHELGNAADIRAPNMALLQQVVEEEFDAVGYASTFFHVDTRRDKERRWKY